MWGKIWIKIKCKLKPNRINKRQVQLQIVILRPMTAPNPRGRLGCKTHIHFGCMRKLRSILYCCYLNLKSSSCAALKRTRNSPSYFWILKPPNCSPPPKNSCQHQPWILRQGLQAVHTAIDAVTSGHVIHQLTLNLMYSTVFLVFG